MPGDLIPWDKSWIIRMGVLDLLSGKPDRTTEFLLSQSSLSDDLRMLNIAIECWYDGLPIMVGESGTLYRFLRFATWHMGMEAEFIKEGTLKTRPICNDPSIITLSQRELLKLDNGTSQWASAAVLMGDSERLSDAPYKLELTYKAVEHWRVTNDGKGWSPRRDATIERQASAFSRIFSSGKENFEPLQSEDYCLARALFNFSPKEGEKRWPSLRAHESDRIAEMEKALEEARTGKVIESRDHRVVQAVAMWCAVNRRSPTFRHPGAVNKSWPNFWEFMKLCYA
jgi:hypothetical protein